jgi:hypothetical protein
VPATPTDAAKFALRLVAGRWLRLTQEITQLDAQLERLVATAAPALVAVKGVGTQTAAALLVAAGDNPERLRSEGAVAHLCGVAPRPEDFPRLLDKLGEAMAKDFDFTEEVRGLQVPTLIVAADADMAPPSHYVEVFKLLGGGLRDGGWMGEGRPKGGHALAILPGLTHYNIASSPLFAAATLAFLDEQPS